MSTKDEKYWLQAILEGKVKPGDAGWERIWKERDCTHYMYSYQNNYDAIYEEYSRVLPN